MGLTNSETQRQEQQRRASDSWMQIKQAEIQHRNATIVALGTLAGLVFSGSWWLSTQAAKEEVRPVAEEVGQLRAIQGTMVNRLDRMEGKMDRILDLIIEERRK